MSFTTRGNALKRNVLRNPHYTQPGCTAVTVVDSPHGLSLYLDLAGKGARALKKKALTDMLRALSSLGLSRHRRAVPQGDREVSAWFSLPLPQEGAANPESRSLSSWANAGAHSFLLFRF